MINVAIFGVGNCAKSFIEGVAYYTKTNAEYGLAFPVVGGYSPSDIKVVLAYDVDARKVGKRLNAAIYSKPNCAKDIYWHGVADVCGDTVVKMGAILDGIAPHMEAMVPTSNEFETTKEEVINELKTNKVDVALIYLPVGSQKATEFYVECFLHNQTPFVNCIPVFIVSDPAWGMKIEEAGIPAIGDDMRSQVGASVLSQVLQEMFLDRGARVKCHYQLNYGGNTDFMNMLDRTRTESKKKSKENVITSQSELRNENTGFVHAGPSDYLEYLGDTKIATIRIEAEGFGGFPITLDCKLQVEDSPNSAGIVIDAVRYLQTARDNGFTGPLLGPSSLTQKTPPVQLKYADAYQRCVQLASQGKKKAP